MRYWRGLSAGAFEVIHMTTAYTVEAL